MHRTNDFIRLRDIIAPKGPLPVSRSTWHIWVSEKRVPQPVKLGPRVTAYRRAEIEAFLADPQGWGAR